MTTLTKQQLENASADVETLAVVVNGTAAQSPVTSRTGQQLKTLAAVEVENQIEITKAHEWATKTSGIVTDTDPTPVNDYSAKEYAKGTQSGTGGSSKDWARKTDAKVDGIDYSSKEFAQGTQTGTGGSSKDWAQKTTGQVDSSGFSSKEFAQGTQASTGGSAKNWAQQTGAEVTGAATGSRSSKSWAQDNLAGSTYGGSAKDWAQSSSSPDGSGTKSAKSYAQDAQNVVAGLSAGVLGYTTKALMDADLAHAANTIAYVTNDSTPANNGYYIKLGASGSGSWQASSYDRVAAVENRLNGYFVTPRAAPIIVDDTDLVVRYPRLIVMRNGSSYIDLDPAAVSLTTFDVTHSPVGGGTVQFHYLDISAIGTTTPIKVTSAGSVPTLGANIVPLGLSFAGAYSSFWTQNVVYTKNPAKVNVLAFAGQKILIDRNNRLGGGAAVYIPRNLYVRSIEQGIEKNGNVANSASTELTTHVKLTLSSSAPSSIQTIFYDISADSYVLITWSTQPEGTLKGYIPLVSIWQSAFTSYGMPVEEYDLEKLRNNVWPGIGGASSAALNSSVGAEKGSIIFDSTNYYGGGLAIYVPRWVYIQKGNNLVNKNGITNAECTELKGYAKLAVTNTTSIGALIYNGATDTVELNYYSTGISSVDLHKELLDKSYIMANIWGKNISSSIMPIMDTAYFVGENQCPYGKGSNVDLMPRLFNTTSFTDITDSALIALGFTRGATDLTANNRPYYGMNFPKWVSGARSFFRCYVETAQADTFPNINVYLWTNSGSFVDIGATLKMEKSLSSTAAIFSGIIDMPVRNDILYFYIGAETQSLAYRVKVTGVQFHVSERNIHRIRFEDYPSPASTVGTTDAQIVSRDAANMARSAALKSKGISNLQKPTAQYNTLVVYGQSLGRGQETWPALSRTNKFGNKMLGANPLPNTNDGANYSTFGSATLQDLVAQSVSGSTQYSDSAEAALTAGADAFGEPVNHGWANFAKFLHNQVVLANNDTSRTFVTYNPSVSGKTIEQLSKVNGQDSTDRYSRFTDGLTKIQSAAGAGNHVLAGIMWMQGEWDYVTTYGSTKATKALYKTALSTLIDNMVADAKTITSQSLKPAFLTYQTGATYTSDTDSASTAGLHVGMAQLETSLEKDGVFMVGPVYPYTDKGGHLDSNGSRWFGQLIAKVWHKVVRLGEDWEPLRPIRITQSGRDIYVDFHVPEPPLVFDLPYVVNTATNYTDKGFRISDNSGAVGISSISIAANTIVKITVSRDTVGTPNVWYASKTTFNGNGCLRDSDNAVALDNYEYKPTQGMYSSANIAALVDKPYPLQNWCVAFFLPVGYSEA